MRDSIFENDLPVWEQVKNSLLEVWEKPKRFMKFFWFFFIQLCLAIFLLVFSFLLPIWLLYGQN